MNKNIPQAYLCISNDGKPPRYMGKECDNSKHNCKRIYFAEDVEQYVKELRRGQDRLLTILSLVLLVVFSLMK